MLVSGSISSWRLRFAGLIGNVLCHYDRALYGLLAPFIAPLFFTQTDPLTALILAYAILPLGLLTKPLGSLFFGWIGDRFGRQQALFCSLCGMALVTASMGCLPTYSQAGIAAPCLLAIGRMLQSFCAAGESTGASVFVLENTPLNRRSVMSSFYDVSSMSGVLIASGLVTFFCLQGWVEEGWRILFWMGSFTALFGLLLRLKSAGESQPKKQRWNLLQALREHKGAFGSIILASGFSHVTYAIPFTLMNGFAPLVTSVTKADIMAVHTGLLGVDMLLLPCFGWLAYRFGKEKVMFAGAIGSAVTAIPLLACLEGAGVVTVTLIRSAIVVFGVAFAAPYHAWKIEQIPREHRYTLLSLGCTLGSQLIGAPTCAVCLWLYQQIGATWAPGLYLTLFGMAAGWIVYQLSPGQKLSRIANFEG